jgi:anaerobic selenocysteine-containing dehydrogenase/N-acetylglutamate synthase-like GNAT family acetyltransferase
MRTERKTNCQLCGYFCGVTAVCENGRVTDIAPDPERYPYDPAVMGTCRRFAANREFLDHPSRINYPLRRKGKRGGGSWERISWEEAMTEISEKLTVLKKDFGAETLSTCISAPHTMYWPMHRFLNAWGSPNNLGIGIVCWNPRIWVNSLTFGWPVDDELVPGITECVIVWGLNPAESDRSLFWKTLKDYSKGEGRLFVVDPVRTETAKLTAGWVPLNPGTDGALALAMIHVIIAEGRHDREFVENHCSGFEKLRDRVRHCTPEWAETITGIPRDVLRDMALAYSAAESASIFTGLGIDHSGVNCTGSLRAIACLKAICGNVDKPGASNINESSDFIPEVDLELGHLLSPEQRRKKLGGEMNHLFGFKGYDTLTEQTLKHGKQLPTRYMTSIHPHFLWDAMTTGKPYPVKALVTMASNPLLCQADTRKIYNAMKRLDLLVCLEHVMTPTAMLADYVLPVTGSFEQPLVQINGGVANVAYGGKAAIPPMYERRPDFYFWSDLGRLCGQERHWPWDTLDDALDHIFEPAGITWEDFAETGSYGTEPRYGWYRDHGFATPSGKVELFSEVLDSLGYDGLPSYTPRHGAEDDGNTLILVTGPRKHPYYSSEFRQIERIRKHHPRPLAHMSQATAEGLGLLDGEDIIIETDKGRIVQTLSLTSMQDGVVTVEYGWWYPEMPAREPSLGGLWIANANVLSSCDADSCDKVLGQWNFKSLPCRVYRKVDFERLEVRNAGASDEDALTSLLFRCDMDYSGDVTDYTLIMDGTVIAACIRLENHEGVKMIRPLAVDALYRRQGLGTYLVERSLPPSTDKPVVLAARGEAVLFYRTLGFEETDWDRIPRTQNEDCRSCPDFERCKPVPMVRDAVVYRKTGS